MGQKQASDRHSNRVLSDGVSKDCMKPPRGISHYPETRFDVYGDPSDFYAALAPDENPTIASDNNHYRSQSFIPSARGAFGARQAGPAGGR